MATRLATRSVLTTAKQTLTSAFSTSSTSPLLRLRPLISAASNNLRHLTPPPSVTSRGFSSRPTSSSLSDPNPNWSNRPPKETILLDGCDFEHWLVVMEKPEGDPTRDEIIDSYIKTLATIVGSEEEARMKIYSVSTRHYFAFGALVSEELSYKLKELPKVRWVLPDSYLDVKNKDYGGEPFINGQAVPYDPKYHEEWVRNNARANERNRRNDRPRNFDRSRNFEKRREMPMGNQNPQGPGPNSAGGPPGNFGGQSPGPNMGGGPPGNYGPGNPGSNMGGGPPGNWGPGNPGPNMGGGGPPRNMGGGGPPQNWGPGNPGPNMGGGPPGNWGPGPNMGGGGPPQNVGRMPPNMGGMQPNNMGAPQNYTGGAPPNNPGASNHPQNFQYGNGPNSGGMPYQSGPGPNSGSMPYQSGPGPNSGSMPGRDMPPPTNYQ